jgi:hypothetical protein
MADVVLTLPLSKGFSESARVAALAARRAKKTGAQPTAAGPPNPTHPTHLYAGLKEDVVAEASAHDYYDGKYYVHPVGENDFDTYPAKSKAEMEDVIKELRTAWPHAKLVRV